MIGVEVGRVEPGSEERIVRAGSYGTAIDIYEPPIDGGTFVRFPRGVPNHEEVLAIGRPDWIAGCSEV